MTINKGRTEKSPIQPLIQILELKSSATHRQEFFKFPPDVFDRLHYACLLKPKRTQFSHLSPASYPREPPRGRHQPSLTPPACTWSGWRGPAWVCRGPRSRPQAAVPPDTPRLGWDTCSLASHREPHAGSLRRSLRLQLSLNSLLRVKTGHGGADPAVSPDTVVFVSGPAPGRRAFRSVPRCYRGEHVQV